MPDAQDIERHAIHAARAHQLQASLDKANASIERLTRHVGTLFDENALLRLELGGDVTAQVRAAAYRVVQADLEELEVLAISTVSPDEWSLTIETNNDVGCSDGPAFKTLIGAVDAAKGGP